MTAYIHHAVIILPAALRDAGNAVAEQMGWGPNNYSVPLTDGEEITHYGLSTVMQDDAAQMFTAAQAGTYPEGFESAAPVVEAMHMDIRPAAEALGHFDAVLDELGLHRFVAEV